MNKDNRKYDHKKIEEKWSKVWEQNKIDNVDLKSAKKPYYNLWMYPYPSAEGLHVGHVFASTGSDIHGRYMRMKGFDVFEPIGFDSGGIHSENYAIKIGDHPKRSVKRAIENFSKQLKNMGNMYDWDHTVDVMNPDYYKWTQWIFVKLFEKGLVYKKLAPVTWCPSCKTTVSDEQTEKIKVANKKLRIGENANKEIQIEEDANKDNVLSETEEEITVCERCKTPIERKNMSQWFLKITSYAERLLNNASKLNWPNKILATQRNWIGKKEGINITYKIENSKEAVTCFTTRPDTNFGATFIVIAPENQIIDKITKIENKNEVDKYIKKSLAKTELERIAEGIKKTGFFTGSYAINNLNGKRLPIWVSDFVLGNVGTGAVVGVPGHDMRDFLFAKTFNLSIIRVVVGKDGDNSEIIKAEQVQEDEGKMVNSDFLDGLEIHEATVKIMDYLEEKGWGKRQVHYKLRDWNISRQRYWGPPIPMIYCANCAKKTINKKQETGNEEIEDNEMAGWFPVPEKDLPVLLPDMEDFLSDGSGKSPLARNNEFVKVKCPKCGGNAERETDVSDTFLDSSWYFLRYPSTFGGDISKKESKNNAFDPLITKKWLPVSQYCGGAEHAVLHLMYSRFITMALCDMDYINFEEPFPNFYAHGLIIKDGAKMSKSKGNVVNPDEYIEKYGIDTLRLYFSFMGPYADGGDFKDAGIIGMQKFVSRIWKLFNHDGKIDFSEEDKNKMESSRHKTIKKVTYGIENFKYNTAIAAIMEYLNILEDIYGKAKITDIVSKDFELALNTICLLISPFAPYLSEELWQEINKKLETRNRKLKEKFKSVHQEKWPEWDKEKILTEKTIIVIQVNGKLRSQVEIDTENINNKELVLAFVKEDNKIKEWIKDKKLIKEIFVPGKLVNLVVR